MITRGHEAAASLMKARDAFAVSFTQAVARIDSEEPQLVEVGRVEHTQNTVIAFRVRLAISRRDFENLIVDRSEMLAQQREAPYVPVVLDIRNRGLQKNVNRISHAEILPGLNPGIKRSHPPQNASKSSFVLLCLFRGRMQKPATSVKHIDEGLGPEGNGRT
jgi:hypothetical protein